MSNPGDNPFDTADSVNPFGADPSTGLEHYDPFGGDAKPPSRPVSPPAGTSSGLDFHDSSFTVADNPYQVAAPSQFDDSQFTMEDPVLGVGHEEHEPSIGLDGEEEEEEEEEEEDEEDPGVFSLAFYQMLFDVDTVQVLDRIFRSCVPFRKNFFETVGKRPDLYGAVWVSATLVFVLACAGNFTNFVRHALYNVPFTYEFNKLPYGALAVYLYVALVPLILWGALAWIDDFELRLTQAYCLYGYAMFPFIVAGLVCVAPWDPVKWTAISVAFVVSIVHIILSLWDILKRTKLIMLIAFILLIAAHVGISLSFALYFFKYTYTVTTKA